MKVKIGPYLNWWGPYQIADLIFGNPPKYVEDETWRHRWSERVGDWLASTKFADFCQWVHDKRKRQVYVHIDNYDVWNMDETLRLILAPMFRKLKQTKHGSGFVDDQDVPLEFRSSMVPEPEVYGDTDANFHKRYEWLLDEMIWVFGADHDAAKHEFYDTSAVDKTAPLNTQLKQTKLDMDAIKAYDKRVQKAHELFGKYYQTFWD